MTVMTVMTVLLLRAGTIVICVTIVTMPGVSATKKKVIWTSFIQDLFQDLEITNLKQMLCICVILNFLSGKKEEVLILRKKLLDLDNMNLLNLLEKKDLK